LNDILENDEHLLTQYQLRFT